MRNDHGLHLCPNRRKVAHFHWYVCIQDMQLHVVQHLMLISQKTHQVILSSCHFSHIHLYIAPRMSKSAVHHLWDLGRRWLNMVSTDTCTWLYSPTLFIWSYRLIIVLSLCLKEDEASRWRYQFNGQQALQCYLNPSDICCKDCIHEQLYCDSSDVTQMLRPYRRNFTSEQLQDIGGGIILGHTSNKNQW